MKKEILSMNNVFPSQEEYKKENLDFQSLLLLYQNHNPEEELDYAVKRFFDKRKHEDIDMNYLLIMGKNIAKYPKELQEQVDRYTTSFGYDKMVTIDQAIFLLGYVEWKVLDTPKEVLLNELVELAKRYADDGSAKLINGIMHKVFSQIEDPKKS
ncbi:MAG: hypothetical protein GXP45_00840 [bacterium]|nr:hypothetical protein [bacterium]